jgi:hypothetical protein|tara:strand:+ start:275 stop:379 length:105 start_codon:yes stop_codon:yes gene_type:complete
MDTEIRMNQMQWGTLIRKLDEIVMALQDLKKIEV